MSLAFFWIFLLLMLCGLPVMFALLIAPSISLMLDGQSHFFTLLVGRMYKGIDNFPLMAIPFFILAGEMMNAGQITVNLVRLSQALIGHVRGGLAQVNILSSMLFAGLSGSAVADTSALGSMLIPAMEKNGYTRRFAAAVTAASSVIGPIIPPSGIVRGVLGIGSEFANRHHGSLAGDGGALFVSLPPGGCIAVRRGIRHLAEGTSRGEADASRM